MYIYQHNLFPLMEEVNCLFRALGRAGAIPWAVLIMVYFSLLRRWAPPHHLVLKDHPGRLPDRGPLHAGPVWLTPVPCVGVEASWPPCPSSPRGPGLSLPGRRAFAHPP